MQIKPKTRKQKLTTSGIIAFLISLAAWYFGFPTPPPLPAPEPTPAPAPAPETGSPDIIYPLYHNQTVKVLRVVDGDTIKIQNRFVADELLSVRIVGIDTPETVHPFKPPELYGPEATLAAVDLLMDQVVTLSLPYPANPLDRYDRLLAYVAVPSGDDFGALMLSRGLARSTPEYPHPRLEDYAAIEIAAKTAKVGMWSDR